MLSLHDKHALNVDQNTTAVYVVQHLIGIKPCLEPFLTKGSRYRSMVSTSKAAQPTPKQLKPIIIMLF